MSSSPQRIVLMVGLPASGKSAWLADRGVWAISSDHVRGLLCDDPSNQQIHARVFATMRYLLRQRLAIGRPLTYIDATHLTCAERRPYIEIAEAFDCDIEAIAMATPLAECLRRNALRDRVVPPDAMEALARKFQFPELHEGFSGVTLLTPDRLPHKWILPLPTAETSSSPPGPPPLPPISSPAR